MTTTDWRTRVRMAFRRHERRWMAAYLAVVVFLVAMIGLPAVRTPVLGLVHGALVRVDARWDRRLEHGEALVAAGRYEEAATYLANLDSIFPAPTVHAGRDRERERLLAALAESYERLGRNGRALDTYRRLAAFDPRHWRNHYRLAQALERLDGGWAIPDEAADAYRATLAIHPHHLPSLRGLMQYHVEAGDFQAALDVWQTFLEAPLLQLVYVYVADTVLEVNVPADGQAREVVLPVALPSGPGRVELHTNGFSLRVDTAQVVAAGRVGVAARPDTVSLTTAVERSADVTDLGGVFRADGPASLLVLEWTGLPRGGDRLRLVVTLFRPLDPDTWELARRSYRNLIRPEDEAAVAGHLLVHPDQAWVDSAEAIPG